ncbi:hypothetical protein WN944_014283 [Citrus x changshan-huyou]|uniref:Uncharacterized protein n=1 Tax=Citrus x changshan-huyou TaxID=2935761 RepID=A0AAP0M5D5_9ROSI
MCDNLQIAIHSHIACFLPFIKSSSSSLSSLRHLVLRSCVHYHHRHQAASLVFSVAISNNGDTG